MSYFRRRVRRRRLTIFILIVALLLGTAIYFLVRSPGPQQTSGNPMMTLEPEANRTPRPLPTFEPGQAAPIIDESQWDGMDNATLKNAALSSAYTLVDQGKVSEATALLEKAAERLPGDTDIADILPRYQKATSQEQELEPYNGLIHHLFTHCLIAYPDLSLELGGAAKDLWIDCITPLEFERILNSLYEKNYILIDIHDIISNPSGDGENYEFADLELPKGKTPLILSFDDVVYDSKKMGRGMVDKLVLTEDGKVATYTKLADGTEETRLDNEFVPILNQFVWDHPDFSFKGVKGTFCLTGFEGILGYRTQSDTPLDREAEKAEALKVVARLKEMNWNFASHSYGHRWMNKRDIDLIREDTQSWEDEVEPLLGDENELVFVWPYGDRIKPGDPKYQVLKDAGFRLFCGVGGKAYNLPESDGTLFMDRGAMDGTSLWHYQNIYSIYFDVDAVRDPKRPNLDN